MLYNWIENIQAAVYPPRCVLCEAAGARALDLCAGCRADLPHQHHGCVRCAANLPTHPTTLCPDCLRRAPAFDAAWAALRYAAPADWLIVQLKFHERLSHARLLGNLMADGLEKRLAATPVHERPEAIVPVPLHPRRWAERGFNQATEIGRPLGRRLGLPVLARVAHRQRDTEHQADLPAARRRANVHNAFAADPAAVAGRRVAILDDVVTTGQTATALGRALRAAGAAQVHLWCAARA